MFSRLKIPNTILREKVLWQPFTKKKTRTQLSFSQTQRHLRRTDNPMQQPHLTCLSSSGLSHGCTDVLNCGKSKTALCLCPCLTKLCRWDRPERVTRPSPEMRMWLALKLLEQKETILSTRNLANEEWIKVWWEHISVLPWKVNTFYKKTAVYKMHLKYMTFLWSLGTP